MIEQTSGLIDIIEPAAPAVAQAAHWPWLAATLAVMLLLVVFALILWKKKFPAYRAIKQLRKLHQQILEGAVPVQDGLILLTQELRHGLRLAQQLPKQAPEFFAEQDKHLWQAFVQQLDSLRYRTDGTLTLAQLTPIVARMESWLRRYCR
jgi:hypothetical protein